jgi:hypothetical protein
MASTRADVDALLQADDSDGEQTPRTQKVRVRFVRRSAVRMFVQRWRRKAPTAACLPWTRVFASHGALTTRLRATRRRQLSVDALLGLDSEEEDAPPAELLPLPSLGARRDRHTNSPFVSRTHALH